MDLETLINWGPVKNLKLTLPVYSDPYFLVDFADRRENIDWNKLFQEDLESETAEGATEISSQRWELSGSVRPSLEFLAPYISSLSVKQLKMNLNWLKRDLSTADQTNSIDAFFYPESYLLPEMALNIGGILFNFGSSAARAAEEKGEALPDLVGPWEDGEESAPENIRRPEKGVLAPEFRGDIDLDWSDTSLTWVAQTLSYTLIPTLNLYGSFDSTDWTTPEDIDFAVNYRSFKTSNTGKLNYSLSLLEGLFTLKNDLEGQYSFQQKYDRGDSIDDATWEQYLKQDNTATYLKFTDAVTLDLRPLKFFTPMANSKITYNTKFYLYQYKYNSADEGFETLDFIWDDEGVITNSLTVDTRVKFWDKEQYLKLSAILPPESEVHPPGRTLYRPSLQFHYIHQKGGGGERRNGVAVGSCGLEGISRPGECSYGRSNLSV